TAETVNIAIVQNGGTTPTGQTFKLMALGNGQSVTFNGSYAGIGSGTVFGHHEIAAEDAVGTAYYGWTPAFGATLPQTEYYSSYGSSEILLGSNGTALGSPLITSSVAFVAPDGDPTSLPSSTGINPFYGTSAAAPAAAAVAALLDQVNPSLNFVDVTDILKDSAIAMPEDA